MRQVKSLLNCPIFDLYIVGILSQSETVLLKDITVLKAQLTWSLATSYCLLWSPSYAANVCRVSLAVKYLCPDVYVMISHLAQSIGCYSCRVPTWLKLPVIFFLFWYFQWRLIFVSSSVIFLINNKKNACLLFLCYKIRPVILRLQWRIEKIKRRVFIFVFQYCL